MTSPARGPSWVSSASRSPRRTKGRLQTRKTSAKNRDDLEPPLEKILGWFLRFGRADRRGSGRGCNPRMLCIVSVRFRARPRHVERTKTHARPRYLGVVAQRQSTWLLTLRRGFDSLRPYEGDAETNTTLERSIEARLTAGHAALTRAIKVRILGLELHATATHVNRRFPEHSAHSGTTATRRWRGE